MATWSQQILLMARQKIWWKCSLNKEHEWEAAIHEGHDSLTSLEVSDTVRFRNYLFERGVSSSSQKRVFSSVRAVINLAIREQGLSVTNVFSVTFIPDDEVSWQAIKGRCLMWKSDRSVKLVALNLKNNDPC